MCPADAFVLEKGDIRNIFKTLRFVLSITTITHRCFDAFLMIYTRIIIERSFYNLRPLRERDYEKMVAERKNFYP